MTSPKNVVEMDAETAPTTCADISLPTSTLWTSWIPKWAHPNSSKFEKGFPASVANLQVPIRSLGAKHRQRISDHLLSLNGHDRHLRFGYSANDHHIKQYIENLNFDRDEVFGIYDRSLLLIAVAHLAYAIGDIFGAGAEFGGSVLPHARGRGYGARLFERAAKNASNRNLTQIFIHALSENTPMIRIATKAGARVERHGCESEAFLQLPAPTLKSRLSEFVKEQAAQADYRLKVRTWRTSEVLR
jgi:RimJ/RimL family protein N-acetyltransferase